MTIYPQYRNHRFSIYARRLERLGLPNIITYWKRFLSIVAW